jgi:lipopolysaccharide biosynthesis glycosyltransferase
MNIVLCADHGFVMPCGVLMYSICINNKDININFYIITDDSLTEEDKKDIEYISQEYNPINTVTFLYVVDSMVENVLWYKSSYYPKQIFYRLFMTELLPKTVDKVLYLDCDIIVRGSLRNLWDIDIDNKSIGATIDGDSGMLETYNRLKYDIALGYFNSGVMLINISYWRDNQIYKQIIDFINNHRGLITLGDQDPMNYIMRNSKIHIPLTYNVQPKFLYQYQYMSFSIYQYKDELNEARVNPIILHFAGCRPWVENCPHPYKEEFLKYKAQTIWKDVPLSKVHVSIKDKMKEFLRKVLTPFGICHYVADYFDRDLKLISHNN